MNVLSFETASYFGGVALRTDAGTDSRGPFEPRGASRCILAAADELLRAHGLTLRDLDAIAVSTGPGLFTGVRVGLALAKTLVWAGGSDQGKAGPALVGIPTLEAVALLAALDEGRSEAGHIAAVTDARRGEVYGALFQIGPDGAPRPVGREIVARPARLADHLAEETGGDLPPGPLVLAGDGAERYRDSLVEAFGAWTMTSPPRVLRVTNRNLAEAVASLAMGRIASGRFDAPETLSPDYVRRPDARRPVLTTDL